MWERKIYMPAALFLITPRQKALGIVVDLVRYYDQILSLFIAFPNSFSA